MKKIKFILAAMTAIMTTMSFVACSDDEEVSVTNPVVYDSNSAKYQAEVNQTVKDEQAKTGNKNAILLVAFGSTWQQAYNAFDATLEKYKTLSDFAGYDVFLSFSSAICINRAALDENGVGARDYYAPKYWLKAFAQEGVRYEKVIVQSLQVIPGEEYTRVINAMKDFQNNSERDIDDNYLSKLKIFLGKPLMNDPDTDVPNLASELDKYYGSQLNDGYVLFMGHGNPDSYDTYKANVRYTELEEALHNINPRYYVGTVDMRDNFKVQVHKRMTANGFTSGKVYCHPLMSIAGDHAHNDMAGDDAEFTYNDELDEYEDTSWKTYFTSKGYTYNDDVEDIKGLLEIPGVLNIWIQHTKDAEEFDYYNSMYPEAE